VALGLGLAYARRLAPTAFVRAVVRAASLGYAMPGTVLALGLIIPLAGLDNHVDAALRSTAESALDRALATALERTA